MYKTTHVCGKLQSQHSVKRLAGKIGLKKVLFLSLRISGGLAEGFKTAACKFVVIPFGSVAEWSIALVLKTSKGQPFVSSNLTASARVIVSQHFIYPLKSFTQAAFP